LVLIADSLDLAGMPPLDGDSLQYAGAATWEKWENHIPQVLIQLWPYMTYEAKLCVYVTAKSFTAWNYDRQAKTPDDRC